MIFVTVGTHEEQFDRLIKEIDELAQERYLTDKIHVQTGYSKYELKNLQGKKMYTYKEMDCLYNEANIIITHGGPASIFSAISRGKVPIVVPRNPEYGEHVDNHQIKFCEYMEKKKKVIAVYDIKDLRKKILEYDNLTKDFDISNSNNKKEFINKLMEYMNHIKAKS